MPRPPRPRTRAASSARAAQDLEVQLARLRAVADAPDDAALREVLLSALGGTQPVVAARAAEIVGRRRLEGLEAALEAAWQRASGVGEGEGVKRDPGCVVRHAVLTALDHLDAEGLERLAVAGARLFQWEPAWGPPVETAAPVRARAALALGRLWRPQAGLLLAELLADPAAVVRRSAIEAILHRGEPALAALLVLRCRIPDEDPVVRAECLSALLRMAPEQGLDLAAPLLRSSAPEDAPEQQVVALSLAESRLPAALQLLLDWLARTVLSGRRAAILTAIAAHRSDAARRFLLDLIAEGSPSDAGYAITALAPQLFSAAERAALLQAAPTPALRSLARQALAETDPP